MRWITRLCVAVAAAAVLSGCATSQPRGWVDAVAWGANYTEDYIYDFLVQTIDGKKTGVSGIQVNEFSRRGTGGGNICCAPMPGVGEIIKVVWRIGGHQERESQWRTYSRDVVVSGTMPKSTQEHSVLIVRFFPGQDLEAELLPGDGSFGASNPRIDKNFFAGPRVMRKKGE